MTTPDSLAFKTEAGPLTQSPELSLQFSDSEINEVIGRKIKESIDHYKTKEIDTRTKKMVDYWLGIQDTGEKIRNQNPYLNNIIHRDLGTRAQNATSRMPDIIVMSPQQQDNLIVKEQTAKIEEWLSIRLDSDVLRRLAKNAVMDNHLKLRGIWKYRYDHFKKDAVIDRLRPEDVILDHTARIPEDGFTADNCEFIAEWLEEPTAVVMAKFPDKKDDILTELDREKTEKGTVARSSKMRYMEVWATMHDEQGDPHEITFWKYNDLILGKSANPYFDDSEESNQEFGIEDVPPQPLFGQPALPQQPLPKRKNFFSFARKPYTIFSGENLGNGPLDDTTVVEVALPMQDIVNKRGRQITLINDWAVPKVVTGAAFLDEEKANNITRDPSEIIFLNIDVEDVRAGFVSITGAPASPALYNDLQSSIQAIDAHFATNPIKQLSGESGEAKQISRDQDLAAADEIAQNMVQRSVEEAANWLVQLAKIFFDEPITASAPGQDSTLRTASISKELIPDDIQIVVRSNAIDKPTMRNLMLELAGMKAVDPYTLAEALDIPNPKEVTQRLIDFLNGPPSGYVKYLQDIGANPLEPAGSQTEAVAGNSPAPEPNAPPVIPQGFPAGGTSNVAPIV